MTTQTFKRGLIAQGIFYALIFIPYYVGKAIAIIHLSDIYDTGVTWVIGLAWSGILGIILLCIAAIIYYVFQWILGVESDEIW